MILDQIVEKRRFQLEAEISRVGRSEMIFKALSVERKQRSLKQALSGQPLAIIAELKKASPSKGVIQPEYQPVSTAKAYERFGANAISVLTESAYFQGKAEDLRDVRSAVNLPILRKDFIFDPYQLYEARVIGADAVLLIAAVLDDPELHRLMKLAEALSLETLVEVHDENELERAIKCGANLIGINNRNLKTFEVDLQTTEKLMKRVPKGKLCVSESGISTAAQMEILSDCGVSGVLIGETLMRSSDISGTLRMLKSKGV